jgi:transposase
MPKGIYINNTNRNHIYRHAVLFDLSAEDIYARLFQNNEITMTLDYLRNLVKLLKTDNNFALNYIMGPATTNGKQDMLSDFEKGFLRQLVIDIKFARLSQMRNNFINSYYGEEYQGRLLSLSTFQRVVHRERLSRKVIQRQHILRDDVAGLQFLDRIAMFDPLKLVDIDETANNPESFLMKKGWAPIGDECIKQQICIGSKTYSTIAAVTPSGYIAWEIIEGNVTHDIFLHFLQMRLQPVLQPEQIAILDNARIHHVQEVRDCLENIFDGAYFFVPPYSPHLKPIEKCFKLVKEWIRDNEDAALGNPVRYINSAFEQFSIGGPRVESIFGCWSDYFNNHNAFREEMDGILF